MTTTRKRKAKKHAAGTGRKQDRLHSRPRDAPARGHPRPRRLDGDRVRPCRREGEGPWAPRLGHTPVAPRPPHPEQAEPVVMTRGKTKPKRHFLPGKIRQSIARQHAQWLRVFETAIGYWGPELGPKIALKTLLAEGGCTTASTAGPRRKETSLPPPRDTPTDDDPPQAPSTPRVCPRQRRHAPAHRGRGSVQKRPRLPTARTRVRRRRTPSWPHGQRSRGVRRRGSPAGLVRQSRRETAGRGKTPRSPVTRRKHHLPRGSSTRPVLGDGSEKNVVYLGTSDDVTTCECCGKPDLKSTVALSVDGGDPVYYGSDCAARALGRGVKGGQGRRHREGRPPARRGRDPRAERGRPRPERAVVRIPSQPRDRGRRVHADPEPRGVRQGKGALPGVGDCAARAARPKAACGRPAAPPEGPTRQGRMAGLAPAREPHGLRR